MIIINYGKSAFTDTKQQKSHMLWKRGNGASWTKSSTWEVDPRLDTSLKVNICKYLDCIDLVKHTEAEENFDWA